jgi:hypothetical protein
MTDPQILCRTCVTLIGYIDAPTGGWWAHETHPADDHDAVPGAWVDGDELMEAIAAGVWEHCAGEGASLVVDDPRNIAGTAAAVARRMFAAVSPAPADASHGLSVQHADALWDAVAIPGPTEPTFTAQHERVCRAVAGIIDDLTPNPGEPDITIPQDQTALRDGIADALARVDGWTWTPGLDRSASPSWQGYLKRADAVLAVLPPPADRAAVERDRYRTAWRSARERAQAFGEGVLLHVAQRDFWQKAAEQNYAATEAHRLALSEALALGTGAPWDAIHDRATELGLPPLAEDPVAQRLGLVPAPADRAAVLREAAEDLATAFGDPKVKHIGAIAASHLRRRARELEGRETDEEHPETPLEKRFRYSERRNDELRAECQRRGKTNLEYAEKIERLEKQLDEVRTQLGAEILRAGQAEGELRRLAAEAQAADQTLRDRIAEAARTVRLRLGPNAIAMAQRGEPIILNMNEADDLADAVLAVLGDQRAAIRAETLREAADAIDRETQQAKNDGVLEPDKFRPCRDASAQLRAMADEAQQQPGAMFSPGEGVHRQDPYYDGAETQQPEGEPHPPHNSWLVEMRAADGSWAVAFPSEEEPKARDRYERGLKQSPDRQWRLVRMTTSYAVAEVAAEAQQDGAQR